MIYFHERFQLDMHTVRNQPQTRFSIAVLASMLTKSRHFDTALVRTGSDLGECLASRLPGRQNHDNTSDI